MIHLSRPEISDEEVAAVTRVLRSAQLAQGDEVRAFENEFAAFLDQGNGTVHAVAVANGTLALQLALMASGVGAGHEVVVPTFSFIASANAVRACGATPVFVDVDPDSFSMLPEQVAKVMRPSTRAIMAVHLFGHPAPVVELAAIAVAHDVPLIEDAAQAHGAAVDGRRVGTFGIGCFSFYPTKNMTTGEGGMVTTTDGDLADAMRLLRNHGMGTRYEYTTFGLNFRMTEMAAAIGRIQLAKLEGWNRARRANAAWLDTHLEGVTVPIARAGASHVYHQYTVRSATRAVILDRLRTAGVGFGIYYPDPIHRTAPYRTAQTLPIAESLSDEVFAIPVRPGLTPDELRTIAEAVNG